MYLTEAELEGSAKKEWLLAAADDDRDGELDTTTLTNAIIAAQGEVDGHLAARYAVPLNEPAPDIIRDALGALALERLSSRHPTLPLGTVLLERIRQARRILEELSAGRLALPGVSAQRRTDNTRRLPENYDEKYGAF